MQEPGTAPAWHPAIKQELKNTGETPVPLKNKKKNKNYLVVGFDHVELAVFLAVLVAEIGLFVGEVD